MIATGKIMQKAAESAKAENRSLQSHIENLEQQLRDSASKFAGLEDKCRTMKDTLTSALEAKEELYELHKQYKMKAEEAIQEIRAEKQHEQSLRELIDRQLSALREQVKERVRQVEQQSREELQCSKMSAYYLMHELVLT
jgi:chromosome segregation ATPase